MRRGKVLVVDDDAVVLELTRVRLEVAGWDVIVRDAAIGTLNAIRREKPDVVLLDVSMPGLSGDLLAKAISENPGGGSMAVIFHSSTDAARLPDLVKRCNALGAIPKTSNADLFMMQFETLMAKHTRRSPPQRAGTGRRGTTRSSRPAGKPKP